VGDLIAGVYRIRNTVNGKVYVGSSINIVKRLLDHKNDLKRQENTPYFQNAWNKYGSENFSFEVIRELHFKDQDIEFLKQHLLANEQIYLDLYESYKRENGYNICPIAGSPLGVKHTEESKQKNSKIHSGSGNSMYGKHHSKKTKEIIGKTQRGKKRTEEQKAVISKANRKRHPSEESKEKNRIANRITHSRPEIKEADRKRNGGENNPGAKLTWARIKEIREKFATGRYTKTQLGLEYSVNRRTITKIIDNKAWCLNG